MQLYPHAHIIKTLLEHMAIDNGITQHLNHKTQQFRICNYLTYYI